MSAPTLRYGTPDEASMLPDRVDRVKKLAEGWVADGHTPSLVVLAARKGVIFLHEAYGVLTPEEDSPPLQLDSMFPISSITKTITATAIMILVEDGLLGLNRPLVDYIPEICGKGTEEVLVHHLLSHTSGYHEVEVIKHITKKNEILSEVPPCEETQHPLVHEYLFFSYSAPLWKSPGVECAYSNHNYALLGEIVRRVSGQSLADFAAERIFNPLNMADTNYIVSDSFDPRVIKRADDAPFAQRIHRYIDGVDSRQMRETPNGFTGIWSTAMDIAIFGQMFLNCGSYGEVRILSRPTVSEMTRNQIPGIGTVNQIGNFVEGSLGFGWLVHSNGKWKYYDGSLHSQESVSHPGRGGAYFWVDPLYELVGIYFSVWLEMGTLGLAKSNFDLFQNAITASVND